MTKLLISLTLAITSICWISPVKKTPAIYQLTIFQYKDSVQEKTLETYFEQALLPALHKLEYNQVGVFKSWANDTSAVKKIYVLVAGKSMDELNGIKDKLAKDGAYLDKGKAYLDAIYTSAPYYRIETIYLKAFSMAPELTLPALKGPKSERVYELRSYESATEKIFRNKVHMFNEGGEIALFKRLNFNAAFYSEVIAGSKMPNLMYMTCFENMTDRDAHWKSFGSDPEWKRLSALPEYQHNVSLNEKNFLRPVDYSDY
ncbi:MAG TPA: NIPSNAP family protein [Chitinophagaceae bacterium]|nr:NIPSNAP family protein [Chitinophagaceae bacterium]HPH33598.1 NIPSNAP family protein [Chitinophagaceae bacterium]HPN57777.1 NIPSNAP family protein [Chitinophagaceae bacterium]